jgi:thioredoxin-related protein
LTSPAIRRPGKNQHISKYLIRFIKTKLIFLTFSLLFTGLVIGQTAPESSSQILDKAYKQAAEEKKNILVVFHASWCGWCKKFEASVNDSSCKAYFDRSYVIVYLDILETSKKELENPGAINIFDQYGGKGGGVPYFLFFDKKGKLLADSKFKPAVSPDAKPENIGCPTTEEEIAAFVEKLKKTSKISEADIAAISERFKKNKASSAH